MDDDLAELTKVQLIEEVIRLRHGKRKHRDSSGHDLCWHHPEFWGLFPEPSQKKHRYTTSAYIFARVYRLPGSASSRVARCFR